LALSFKRRGMLDRACECILGALGRERLAPYLVLQAQLYNQLKDNAARDLAMEESMHLFGDKASMSDWELCWFREGAQLRADKADMQRATAEQQRRQRPPAESMIGKLPILNPEEKSP